MLSQLTRARRGTITGESVFPSLITNSFTNGLHTAFNFAIVMCLRGAARSWTRGGKDKAPALEAVEERVLEDLVPEPAAS